jgi:hypothetical protein
MSWISIKQIPFEPTVAFIKPSRLSLKFINQKLGLGFRPLLSTGSQLLSLAS